MKSLIKRSIVAQCADLMIISFNPSQVLSFAQSLNSNSELVCEASDRAVISRSYNSSYHFALEIISKFALPEAAYQSCGSHQKNLNKLIECERSRSENFMAIKQIGYIAARLLNPHRTDADYNLGITIGPGVKDECLAKSKLISEKAAELLKSDHVY